MREYFLLLAPDERREVLRQLIADLDLPQPEQELTAGEAEADKAGTGRGALAEWRAENVPAPSLEPLLRRHLPDFNFPLSGDAGQLSQLQSALSALTPTALYELHRGLTGITKATLTPEEIVGQTWGTITAIDPQTLREIIEDEDYCGY